MKKKPLELNSTFHPGSLIVEEIEDKTVKKDNPLHEVLIWEKIRTIGVLIVITLQSIQLSHFMGWL